MDLGTRRAVLLSEPFSVFSHTLGSDFHPETYIGIGPYRTLAVVELQSTAIYGSHVICYLIV